MPMDMQKIENFSIVDGGPFDALMGRIGFVPFDGKGIMKEAVAIGLLTWLPLLLLTYLQGHLFSGAIKVPFFTDIVVHVRLLVAVPLLIAAVLIIRPRLSKVVEHFLTAGIVREEDSTKFDVAVSGLIRLRDSTLAEVILLVLSYCTLYFLGIKTTISHDISAWYAVVTEQGWHITLAGWYYFLISAPISLFLLWRWTWRFLIWAYFLWRVSKLDLHLSPVHPDNAGGLGFLGMANTHFAPILVAQNIVLSSMFAHKVFFEGASVLQFRNTIIGIIVIYSVFPFLPLLVFSGKMLKVKRAANFEYGALAKKYVDLFHNKWVHGKNPQGDELLGSADIQSLADLANSYSVMKQMRTTPFDRKNLIQMAVPVTVPFLPLALTVMPLEDIIKQILKALM